MRNPPTRVRVRRAAALAAILSLLAEPTAPIFAGAGPLQTAKPATPPPTTAAKPATGAPPATQKPAPAATGAPAAAAAAPVDGGWPRLYNLASGGSILVYTPQIASWVKHTDMVAFSAVSYRPKAGKPAMGTIKLEAKTKVAVSDRLVSFNELKIVETNFHELPKESVREITAEITKAFPPEERVIALDRVLASFDKSTIIPNNVDGVKADPPPIFFSKTPAVIVVLDGEPIWSPINQNDLKYAVNTNWDLFQHSVTNTYFLRNNDTWFKATDLKKGDWAPAGTLPESFKKLPAEENWKDVKANLPGRSITAKAMPKVFVTFTPGELILLTGEPNYLVVGKTDLLWVSNTESDLFRLGKTGPVYYLVAGRWFSAPDFTGPWTFATTSLPEAFKQIPLEHDRSRVLASVPGTDQAAEAVLLAQIPQTARVNRKETKAPEVAFNGGKPELQPIEKTSVQRAVNTDKDIFKVGDLFYMCYQGVWFFSAAASGPWEVATMVPQEIYQIPVSSPSHHVTYVTIEEDDDDWVVYAAAAGYTGMMVAWGCAVWGSGWYYPPYYGYGGFYPYYYPHFPTYGYSAWYNPYTGAYGRSARVYGPYGGAGVGARYNPRTGTYARGAAAYGPYGSRGVAQAYNPRTGAYASTRQGSNVYGSWGSTAVQRGDDWAATNRVTNNRTGTTTRTTRTDDGAAVSRSGNRGTVAAGSGGDVYAGRDGNVYRKQDGGSWQKYENGGWNTTDRQPDRSQVGSGTATPRTTTPRATPQSSTPSGMDSATRDQLDRDTAARREGTTRTNDYGAYKGGSNTTTRGSGTGSYRGGGGGGGARPAPRGGGGRRR